MRDDAVLGRALPLDRGLGPDTSKGYARKQKWVFFFWTRVYWSRSKHKFKLNCHTITAIITFLNADFFVKWELSVSWLVLQHLMTF